MMIRSILFAVIVCFFASFVSAQMYQYRDENGNLCFTDDPGRIPQAQQETAKSMPSIKTPALMNTMTEPAVSSSDEESDAKSRTDLALEKDSQELNRIKEDLDNTYRLLQEKRASIHADNPSEDASAEEFNMFRKRVLEFNSEVEAYQIKQESFEKQVQAFNDRVKQQKADL